MFNNIRANEVTDPHANHVRAAQEWLGCEKNQPASAMFSSNMSTQAQIKAKNSLALYTHCRSRLESGHGWLLQRSGTVQCDWSHQRALLLLPSLPKEATILRNCAMSVCT